MGVGTIGIARARAAVTIVKMKFNMTPVEVVQPPTCACARKAKPTSSSSTPCLRRIKHPSTQLESSSYAIPGDVPSLARDLRAKSVARWSGFRRVRLNRGLRRATRSDPDLAAAVQPAVPSTAPHAQPVGAGRQFRHQPIPLLVGHG